MHPTFSDPEISQKKAKNHHKTNPFSCYQNLHSILKLKSLGIQIILLENPSRLSSHQFFPIFLSVKQVTRAFFCYGHVLLSQVVDHLLLGMTRALEEEEGLEDEIISSEGKGESSSVRHGHTMSMIVKGNSMEDLSGKRYGRIQDARTPGKVLNRCENVPTSRLPSGNPKDDNQAEDKDIELMKERFAKLLLGEDMSGGGKGVSSALALSNAITNTAASVFGEQRKLEPMPPEQRARWKKEIEWLLSVTDYIVEFAPTKQMAKDGTCMEIMTTKQRTDLQTNIPALKKLDIMLIDCLDNFKDQNEFYYVSQKGSAKRKDDKWWLPTVKVPPNGLSDATKKWIQSQKDAVNQVLKAAMAINAQVLSEMEIPENYIESLPKNGRSSLGDSIYKSIRVEYFDPEQFLSTMDLSSEHKIVDLKNRIEASIIIWRRKMNSNKDGKAPWGPGVSLEKREVFEERAETILLILKHRFPGISQSSLDISKIEYNKDVGHAVLESYSRILESLAHKVLSQIEEVIQADSLAQNPSLASHKRSASDSMGMKFTSAGEETETLNAGESRTLLDFMSWSLDEGDGEMRRRSSDDSVLDLAKDGDKKSKRKLKIEVPRKSNYT